MTHLHPCPSCHRHVKLADEACPFCRSAMPRVREGVLLAAGAAAVTLVVSLAACGESPDPGYGGPPYVGGAGGTATTSSTHSSTATTTTSDGTGGGGMDAYGPPPFDGGSDGG